MMKQAETRLAVLAGKPGIQWLILGAITLGAAVLRFYKLGEWSFWIDEIYTLNRSQLILTGSPQPFSITLTLVASVLKFSPINEWSGRLAPAVIGILTIPILYFPIKKLLDSFVALTSMALLAVSPWHILWSQNARFYTTLFLLYALALLLLFLGLERKSKWWVLLGLVLFGLATNERLFAAFFVPVYAAYLLLQDWLKFEDRIELPKSRWLLILLVPILIFAIYDFYVFYATGRSDITGFWLKFVGDRNTSPVRFLSSFVYRIGIPLIILGALSGGYLAAKKDKAGLLFFVSAVLPPISLAIGSLFIRTVDRYAFVSLISWIILGTLVIKQASQSRQSIAKVAASALFLIIFADSMAQNMLYYQYQHGSRPDWKNAFAQVAARQHPGDLVFATRPEIGRYYLQQDVNSFYRMEPDKIKQNEQRAWFVVNTSTVGVDPALLGWIKNNSRLVEVFDVQIPGKIFDMRVYLYDPGINLSNEPSP